MIERAHITGGRGFVAGHLEQELRAAGCSVTTTDVEYALAPELVLEHSPQVVVHAGALVGRELRGMGSQRAIELNVTSTHLLASACAAAGLPLVYLSTSEVYGPRRDEQLVFETDELELPHNLYGMTKRWGEDACRLAFAGSPHLLTIARLSMPYGPGHPPGAGRAALTNFLWAALHGDPLIVHRGARRSWCWIGDTVRALRMLAALACRRAMFTRHELVEITSEETPLVVNVGRDDNERTMLEVAELALELVGELEGETGAAIYEVDPPAGFSLVKRLDVSLLRELGWKPSVELEDGARRTLHWLLHRKDTFYR